MEQLKINMMNGFVFLLAWDLKSISLVLSIVMFMSAIVFNIAKTWDILRKKK